MNLNFFYLITHYTDEQRWNTPVEITYIYLSIKSSAGLVTRTQVQLKMQETREETRLSLLRRVSLVE